MNGLPFNEAQGERQSRCQSYTRTAQSSTENTCVAQSENSLPGLQPAVEKRDRLNVCDLFFRLRLVSLNS